MRKDAETHIDDEEEFENIDEDKYVDLEKSVNMECIYSNKFRKWIPQKISNLVKENQLLVMDSKDKNE